MKESAPEFKEVSHTSTNNCESAFLQDAWVAHDKDGTLCLYWNQEPYKGDEDVWCTYGDGWREINPNLFPAVKWTDAKATEVEITATLRTR